MNRNVYIIIFFFNLLCVNSIYSQTFWKLNVQATDLRIPSYQHKHNDTLSMHKELIRLLKFVQQKGYLAASIDSIQKDSTSWFAILNFGPQFRWARLSPGNINMRYLARTGFREKIFWGEPIRFERILAMNRKLFREYENNGYPFAVVGLDSIVFSTSDSVAARLHVNQGPSIVYDSIIQSGKGRVADAYLRSYLSLKKGKPYNESHVRKIESRLNELPFLSPASSPIVWFKPEGAANISLTLNKRNANQFSGIIGLVPQSDLDGGFLITGDVKIRLHNLLKRGELADIQWQRLQTATQNLSVQLHYPFLFNIPIGLDARLQFFRVDTAFYTVALQASAMYLMTGTDFVRVFYQYQTSRKILNESGQSAFPGIANTDFNLVGIGAQTERLDFRVNPRKGYVIKSDLAIGAKNLTPTPSDTINVIDSAMTGMLQISLFAQADGYIPLFKRFAIKLAAKGGWQFNSMMFYNELYRIGGLRTLRGFDEESIYASAYVIGTLEFRYLLDEFSHVMIFGDAGWHNRSIRNENYQSFVVGFGAGITFNTRIGMFTVSYALGAQKDQPIDFRRSKIHLGYITFF